MLSELNNINALLGQNKKSISQVASDKDQKKNEGDIQSSFFVVEDVINLSHKEPAATNLEVKAVPSVSDNDNSVATRPEAQVIDKEQAEIEDRSNNQLELSEEEKEEVTRLKERDSEVRQHEQAHLAAAGQYAKGVSYDFEIGPDGQAYAVGGEVAIDTSEVRGNPDATIAKARAIQRAANAPAHPSSQDRSVAVSASRMEADARSAKLEEAQSQHETKSNGSVQQAAGTISENTATGTPVSVNTELDVDSSIEAVHYKTGHLKASSSLALSSPAFAYSSMPSSTGKVIDITV
ncbi:MAG: hypothetical protein ISR96_04005 [Nitrospira sp.]|nr:hypothetical protein [bacterium]MBL7048677.1 hypothetical protein [Nitrospira sp.]